MVEQKKMQMDAKALEETQNLKINKIILSYALRDYTHIREENMESFKKHIKEETIDQFKPKDMP